MSSRSREFHLKIPIPARPRMPIRIPPVFRFIHIICIEILCQNTLHSRVITNTLPVFFSRVVSPHTGQARARLVWVSLTTGREIDMQVSVSVNTFSSHTGRLICSRNNDNLTFASLHIDQLAISWWPLDHDLTLALTSLYLHHAYHWCFVHTFLCTPCTCTWRAVW